MTEPNVVAIVEVRMTSSRLPGKHLLLANGKPILQHLVERLKNVKIIKMIYCILIIIEIIIKVFIQI